MNQKKEEAINQINISQLSLHQTQESEERAKIEDQRSKHNFLQKIYQDSKNSDLSNHPDDSFLLSKFEQNVDQYKGH
ncbi:hypothetical protein DFH28DRAFT_1136362 [Melampsora americana]|nr:hypothetical protein DFH28DRAFT_1136362 [Melampsora americana]